MKFNLLCTILCVVSVPLNGQLVTPAGHVHNSSINAANLSLLGLTGKGIIIYQWEASEDNSGIRVFPDTGNTYLSGRMGISYENILFSSHATTMAQIMVGKGADSSLAGLAPDASIKAYNYLDYADSAFVLASSKMRLALHAYAENYGWNGDFWYGLEEIDPNEDYNWGRYTLDTRFWDSLVYANPFYLPVRSSGNSRGEANSGKHYFYKSVSGSTSNYVVDSSSVTRDADGDLDGFDCLPPISTAKNGLVVGAADLLPNGYSNSYQVVIDSLSAFGPTDDGRIKPDFVAGGEKTSQAAAAVTGVMALLSELFYQEYGKWPLSSTLRSVAINSCYEAGVYPGPDYRFGHGLLNAAKAAELISNRNLFEDTLQDGNVETYYFYAAGDSIKLSLAWADPPANPVTFANDPSILDNATPMLINDLDAKLERVDQVVSPVYPWKLYLPSPSNPAFRGDNSVDNVEVLETYTELGSVWKLEISHKASLYNNHQAFSLAFDGLELALIYQNSAWHPFEPSSKTGAYHIIINENEVDTIPKDFKGKNLIIKKGARVYVK